MFSVRAFVRAVLTKREARYEILRAPRVQRFPNIRAFLETIRHDFRNHVHDKTIKNCCMTAIIGFVSYDMISDFREDALKRKNKEYKKLQKLHREGSGHSDNYLPDSGMQVTIAFNHFGERLIQRMPRCRRGYIHVVNNDFTRWEMYAIGGSASPTINSQGNRYIASFDNNVKEVTKRLDTSDEEWMNWNWNWNWRSEGDILVNGAFFVASGQDVGVKYEKAYSVEPKSAADIDLLTLNAGVLRSRGNKMAKWTGYGSGADFDSNPDGFDDYDDYSGSQKPYTNNSVLATFLTILTIFLFLHGTGTSIL